MKIPITQLILNLLYPPRCAFCGERLSPKSAHFVCTECANNLPYTRKYFRCKRCGKPLAESSIGICRHCSAEKSYISRKTSAFVYTDMAKDGIVTFKKEQNVSKASTFATYIAEMVKYDFKGIEFDYIVSVPPRIKKFNESNYDQASELARAVSLKLSVPYLKGIMKQTVKIQKQSSMSYAGRLENVKGKFAVTKPSYIKDKTILVIDDVCTSGATLNECGRVLKSSGAYRVYAATLATVPAIK